MKNKIIRPYDPHFKAHIQYGYGANKSLRKRAWVTYISYQWDDLFPPPSALVNLMSEVRKFAQENDLSIEMEQCTDLRFNYVLHGHQQTNSKVDADGNLYGKDGSFISPIQRYR